MRAKESIQYWEAFLYIPYRLLLTVDTAMNDPILSPIIKNEEIFRPRKSEIHEQYILFLILLHEF